MPIVDEENHLKGLITIKDIEKAIRYPNSARDKNGRLLVGAAIGVTNDALERVKAVYDAGVDVVVLDSAHGHSKNIINKVKEIKEAFPDLDLSQEISQQVRRQRHLLTQAQTVLSRYRTWFNLYNPCRCRYRCTADYCCI